MLYVKLDLPVRSMMAESLCGLLAHCLGLHTPRPFLVTVRPAHVGRTGQHPLLAFGSEDVSQRSLARPIHDLGRLLELLQARKVADLACVFDEWVANEVRSPNDILVSPESHVYLIDHEAAFPSHLRAEQPATNWLAARLIQGLDDRERLLLLKRLRGRLAALHRVQLGEAPQAVQFASDGMTVYPMLLQFLRDRLHHLDRIISERTVPEQRYLMAAPDTLNDTPSTDAAHRTTNV